VKVLFMCTANSCRSQMAETWARHLFPSGWDVFSGGLLTYPITPATKAAMAEAGLDMMGQDSKTIDTFNLDSFDLVVTLSKSAGLYLPALSHPDRHVKRPIADPMSAKGNDAERAEAFREGRERVRDIVAQVVAGDIAPGS